MDVSRRDILKVRRTGVVEAEVAGGAGRRSWADDAGNLQRDPPAFLGGPIAGVADLDGFGGQAQIGERLPAGRHAFHEVLNLLQVAARPLLFQANELPAGLAIDLLGDVNARELFLVGQIARQVVVGRDVGKQRSAAGLCLDDVAHAAQDHIA